MPVTQRWFLTVGLVAVALLIALSMATGAGVYGAPEVAGFYLGDPTLTADPKLAMILETLRLPRTLAALVVGACLAVAATLLQSATRNPLAEPGLLGINSGAVFGLVLGLTYFGIESTSGYLVWSGAGALLGNVVVLGLGLMLGPSSPLKLVLVGVAMNAVFGGMYSFLLISNRVALDQFRFWNLGSLAGADLVAVQTVLPLALVSTVLALALCQRLTLMQMGDQQARALGVSTSRVRFGVLIGSTLFTACAIAIAGPVGFVGFLAAYCGRMVEPVALIRQVVFSAVMGALFLLAADILARWLVQPFELPVGTLLALVGAPALIAVVLRGGFRSLLSVK
ncbi:FecCD family ABC transporter permease [Marinobacter xestospongiae]|uniref:FecCD family ABC transporter permease n=1 Tax=Marinobacter xestospongiae TaxID=994319 RepID=UPI0020059117|nr:iron ABC transporter permease [Marinobacter xestospongiae]MCK7566748.1 iron ABC transporter permease [Marinobacter xestospongiae]